VTCATCRQLFEAADKRPDTRVREVDFARAQCACEREVVSAHSPGQVADSEILIRILVAPQHMAKGKVRPRASSLADAEFRGLSIFREKYTSKVRIRKIAEDLVRRAKVANGEKAGVFGVLRIECSIVRASKIDLDIFRGYCVYDTALNDDPSHAEIFQRVSDGDESLWGDRRRLLFESIKNTFVSVEDFEGGLLRDLAPTVL